MLHTSLTDHLATVTTVREGCLLSGKTFRQNGVEKFTAPVILRGPKFLYSKVSKSPLKKKKSNPKEIENLEFPSSPHNRATSNHHPRWHSNLIAFNPTEDPERKVSSQVKRSEKRKIERIEGRYRETRGRRGNIICAKGHT